MRQTISRVALAGLLVAGTGCEDALGPAADGADLSTEEASTLAYGVSAQGTYLAEDLAWGDVGSDGAAASLAPLPDGVSASVVVGWPTGGGPTVHGTSSKTIETEGPCPQGGSLHTLTDITFVADSATKTGTADYVSTATPAACAFTVDDMDAPLARVVEPGTVIAITGTPSLVHAWTSEYGWTESRGRGPHLQRGALDGTIQGSFDYETTDGRAGSCEVDLAVSFDPETRTKTITGTFCGHDVDVVRELRRRDAASDRGDRGRGRDGRGRR